MQKTVREALKELPPAIRILVALLIMSVGVLFWMVINNNSSSKEELKRALQKCEEKRDSVVLVLQTQIDHMQIQRLNDKIETVNELRRILHVQDSVKNSLKNLK